MDESLPKTGSCLLTEHLGGQHAQILDPLCPGQQTLVLPAGRARVQAQRQAVGGEVPAGTVRAGRPASVQGRFMAGSPVDAEAGRRRAGGGGAEPYVDAGGVHARVQRRAQGEAAGAGGGELVAAERPARSRMSAAVRGR